MAATDTEESLLAELAALQAAGPHPCDPVGLHYMTQLANRMPTQPEAVRRLLAGKLSVALSHYREQLSQPQTIAQLSNKVTSPLAELNRYIDSRSQADDEVTWSAGVPDRSEMKSVRQFKQAWSRIRAEDQVDQAILQGPKNPGPINSHTLVLRTLTLMRQLSPAYLQRFLAQADALLCLERVTAKGASKGTSKPPIALSKPRTRARLTK